jgi:ElaB/YqjD/DUF883 family membrane-anchored ribosome-binding protein
VGFNAVVGAGPAAQAEAATEPVTIAEELGLTARSEAVDASADLDPLEDLVASRSSREAAETAARQAQAKADRAEYERQKAAARAKAAKAAKAARRQEEIRAPRLVGILPWRSVARGRAVGKVRTRTAAEPC